LSATPKTHNASISFRAVGGEQRVKIEVEEVRIASVCHGWGEIVSSPPVTQEAKK